MLRSGGRETEVKKGEAKGGGEHRSIEPEGLEQERTEGGVG